MNIKSLELYSLQMRKKCSYRKCQFFLNYQNTHCHSSNNPSFIHIFQFPFLLKSSRTMQNSAVANFSVCFGLLRARCKIRFTSQNTAESTTTLNTDICLSIHWSQFTASTIKVMKLKFLGKYLTDVRPAFLKVQSA